MSLPDELKQPHRSFMPVPFWFWNDAMDEREIRRQIQEMARRNIGGFFMHARMGRVTPYMSDDWLNAIRVAVEEAAIRGMQAWIYDEDGWPSGYGGGAVNALGDDYLQQYAVAEVVDYHNGSPPDLEAADVVAAFTARHVDNRLCEIHPLRCDSHTALNGTVSPAHADRLIVFRREHYKHRRFFSPESWADGYVDVLNPTVTRAFIETIYARYREVVGEHFGSTIPGIFTDEPNYHDHDWTSAAHRLPISPTLEREFQDRYGSPLLDALATIAFGGPDALRARWCYHGALAHLFARNFTAELAAWCDGAGVSLTGHYLLEESLRAAPQVIGDVMQHYVHQQIPGTDHLGKLLELTDFWSSSRVLVKQAASVAHQFNKPRVLCETFAGGGWDFGPVEQKWMGDWLYALGINLCCQHAFHYSLRGFRKRDYPPSLSFQQPWWPLSGSIGAHFARLGYLLTQGRRAVRVLVLHPIESFFATHTVDGCPWPDDPLHDAFKRLVHHLVSNQIDFDFGNEALITEHGRVDDRQIHIAEGCYDVVIVPHSITWRTNTTDLLEQFVRSGGHLLFVEPLPTHVDARPDDRCRRLLSQATSLGRWDDPAFERRIVDQLTRLAPPACRLTTGVPADRNVVAMHRRTNDHEVFFLTSAAKEPHTCRVAFHVGGSPMLLDTTTGHLDPLPHSREKDACHIALDFDYGRSFPIVFVRRKTLPDRLRLMHERVLCRPNDSVRFRIANDNVLPLDRGELSIEGRSLGETLLIDAARTLGEHATAGQTAQLAFAIHTREALPRVDLLSETPQQFHVRLNGQSVPMVPLGDWFIDPCLRRVAIPGGLPAGDSTLEVRFRWSKSLELEPFYLAGDFGVYPAGTGWTIGAAPATLRVGSWHEQGLPFYAGIVEYPFTADIPAGDWRWELCCPRYRNAIHVQVNERDAGDILWAPHCLDITAHIRPGRQHITLQVANSLRNFLGPHHLANEDDVECLSPGDFVDCDRRTSEYRLKPAGLLGEVVLRGYEVL